MDDNNFGESFDKTKVRSRGESLEAAAPTKSVSDTAKEALSQISDQARASFVKATDQAKDAYGKASETARGMAAQVDPLVKEKPYQALGLAALVGLAIGLLMNRSGHR